MKRCFLFIYFFALATLSVSANGEQESSSAKTSMASSTPATVKVAALVGPSGIGMGYLFANPPKLGSGTRTTFEAYGSVDQLLPKLLNGDIDIGILPPNVAAKLYNLDRNSIVAGAIVGNNMLTVITRDPSLSSLSGLAGQTVSVAGQGSTPEYILRALIIKSALPENSVTLDFSIPVPEIAAALISGKIQYALLPEPFATIAIRNGATGINPVRRAISLREPWQKAGFGADFPMTICVVRTKFARQYPETVRAFLAAYKASIDWTVTHPGEAGPLVEAAGLGLKAPIVTQAIPSCNLVFIPAAESRTAIEKLLAVFLEYSPEAIGGTLPDEGFYFK